jgi:PhzF family phenazine biosynthesis protein
MPLPEPRFAGIPPRSVFSNEPADTTWMQQVAAEMKHSETAFIDPVSGGWNLRWFTLQQEVELCGHATLACAFVLLESGKRQSGLPITFETLSGTLTARKEGE